VIKVNKAVEDKFPQLLRATAGMAGTPFLAG
jgi:hypothetical protein